MALKTIEFLSFALSSTLKYFSKDNARILVFSCLFSFQHQQYSILAKSRSLEFMLLDDYSSCPAFSQFDLLIIGQEMDSAAKQN